MPGRADGVTHVVQAVEHRHQVVVLAGVAGGGLDLEADAIAHAGLLGAAAGGLDRLVVVVGADERRVGEGAGHDDRRGAVAAADVGDAGAPLELVGDAVERRQPRVDEIGVVARPEEALAALVDVMVVLVPAEAGPGAGGVGDPRRVQHRAERVLKQPRQIRRAVLVAERDRLLGRQAVGALARVVGDEAPGGLGVEPLAHVALGRPSACRQLA